MSAKPGATSAPYELILRAGSLESAAAAPVWRGRGRAMVATQLASSRPTMSSLQSIREVEAENACGTLLRAEI